MELLRNHEEDNLRVSTMELLINHEKDNLGVSTMELQRNLDEYKLRVSTMELLRNHEEDKFGVSMTEWLPSYEDKLRVPSYKDDKFRVPAAWEMVGNFGEDDPFRVLETKQVKKSIDVDEETPVGFQFEPKDEESAVQYLISKASGDPLPASDFREVEAIEFYCQHPKYLGDFSNGEREWDFFIHTEEKIQNGAIRTAGNNLGLWRLDDENPISDTKGNVLATKSNLIYFFKGLKISHWKLDEIRLPIEFYHLRNC